MVQIYNNYLYNKNSRRMAAIYLPSEKTSVLSFSGQTILLHIISNLKCYSDDPFNENDYFLYKEEYSVDYIKSQSIELHWKYFVDKKILSKNKFYQGIKELVDIDLLYTFDFLPKNIYMVNYYFINNMSNSQYKRFQNHMTSITKQDLSSQLFKQVVFKQSTEPLVTSDKVNVK